MKTRLQILALAAIVVALIALSSCGGDHGHGPGPRPEPGPLPWADGVWRSEATLTVTGDGNCWDMAPASVDTFVVLNGEIVDGDPAEGGNWTDEQGQSSCPMIVNGNSFSVDCSSGGPLPGTTCSWQVHIRANGTVSGDHASGVIDIASSHSGECAELGLPDCSIHAVVASQRIGPPPARAMAGAGVNDAVSGGLWGKARAGARRASLR